MVLNFSKILCLCGLLAAPLSLLAQSARVTPAGVSVQAGGLVIAVPNGDPAADPGAAATKSGQVQGKVSVTASGEGAVAQTNIGGGSIRATGGTGGAGAGATPTHGRMSYTNVDLSQQDFSGRNLTGAALSNVDLSGALLRKTNLARARLSNVDLSQADLRGANLLGAALRNVTFEEAHLDAATWTDGRVCAAGSLGRCR